MANEVLQKLGTPIVFADATDYSSAGSGYTRTDQIDLTSLAAGAARQSDKVDLSKTAAKWARQWAIFVGIEFDVAPTAGDVVSFYWSGSASATAGTGNAAGAGGSDAAYKASEEAEWLAQAEYLGSLAATNDAATTVQYARLMTPPSGVWIPGQRYGQVIVYNETTQALEGDAVEMFVALVPLIDEVQ